MARERSLLIASHAPGKTFRALPSMVAVVVLAGSTAIVGWGMVLAPGAKFGVRCAGLLLGGLMSALAWRATRVGVAVVPGGIVVRNWWSSRVCSWGEVAAFTVGDGANAVQPTYTLRVELRDGRSLKVRGLSASAIVKRDTHVHEVARKLNAELSRDRSHD